MTDAELLVIGRLIDLCRLKGVRKLANDGFSIELGEPLDTSPSTPAKPAVQPDLCKCGHPEHMHTNGACLSGCEPDKCLPDGAKP